MASDDELKDEELVDFEGSDYDIDGDYEEGEEEGDNEEKVEEASAQQFLDLAQGEHHDFSDAGIPHSGSSSKIMEGYEAGGTKDTKASALRAENTLKEAKKGDVEAVQALKPAERDAHRALYNEEVMGSSITGIIQAVSIPEKGLGMTCQVSSRMDVVAQSTNAESIGARQLPIGTKDLELTGIRCEGNDISGPAPGTCTDSSGCHSESELVDGSPRLVSSSKPDLEDGELDETAVPQNCGLSIEEEVNDQISGREKKRKLEGSGMQRHMDGYFAKQEGEETGDFAGKLHQSLGSEKAMEHLKGIPYTGSRGMGLRMIGLGQGSLAPGIMGPGRPLMPIGMGSLAQGFNPFGGLIQHGRPQVHLQEVLAQEHLLRAHALQLAQETLATAIRSSSTRPLGAAAFQPFVGFDIPGPRSHSPKHFLRPMPDLVMGPMGSFARGQRPSLPAGRAGLASKVGGQAVYNGMGRQFGWPGGLGPNEALKRSCGRGREFCTGLWGDVAEGFGHKPGGIVHSRPLIHSVAQFSLRHLNPDNTIFCQTSPGVIQAENDLLHNGFDARWKIENERRLRSGLSSLRTPDNSIVRGNTLEGGREFTNNSEKDGETKLPRSLATRLGPPAQSKVTTSNKPYSAEVPVASNVIKLHQPVRKSRILKVSGLPEDTPILTVIEVFEMLGKITPPSFDALSEKLLDEEVASIKEAILPVRQKWEAYGVSLVGDGWSNIRSTSLEGCIRDAGDEDNVEEGNEEQSEAQDCEDNDEDATPDIVVDLDMEP
ncbi:hypothetical protein L7F22_000957 [Adiantum nelumboides]|nr:hypothetical protein [Adiantum nelumboides]